MKKTTLNSIVVVFIFCTNLLTVSAQEKNAKIAEDLNTLITKSSSYQNYKVIEKGAVFGFQSSLDKYIEHEQNTQDLLRKEIVENKKNILGLQNQIQELKKSNAILTAEKANISFLGLSISKSSYSVTMWTLFLGTLFVAGILFYKFKNANAVTKHSKSVLKDVEEEYESYRRVCIEREQGLRRQLFEEAKKRKELKNVS
ncbi:hypothetical protein FIA58_015120 [Flavobacterium jejuense]|uniref:tRNA (Guanine-N1)-methyltransferase n=1 Tax=Flavobacterium jejuense TaxID=1544455 RepID=A0ABX0IWV0_9FLAO|nr:hypothetical protein [Flavobacterium jejuense]NHN27013.1 hypothetical protein [Flavobacterium jejuense]